MIKKSAKSYTVKSKSSGREMGTYPSKKQAIKRLLQVEYFKNKKA
jgi:hypothetical protein